MASTLIESFELGCFQFFDNNKITFGQVFNVNEDTLDFHPLRVPIDHEVLDPLGK